MTPVARRVTMSVLILVAAVIVLPYWPAARSTILTAALVPDLLRVGPQPLSMAVAEPRRESTVYGNRGDRLDIYVPANPAPDSGWPAVVLALGVHPQPIDHPDIYGVATAIARLGVVVGVPDSKALRNLVVTPDEPRHLADGWLALHGREDVDDARVGLAGFSAGASIALVTAADMRISDRVRFVSAFGGYADAETLLVDVATRTSAQGGQTVSWQPDAGIRRDILALAINALPSGPDRARLAALLEPIVAADAPPAGPDPAALASLAGDALQIYLLFTAPGRAAAQSAVEALSPDLRARLAGISPVHFAADITAPVFILHGRTDTAIPVAHAPVLVRALGDRVARLTLFGSFGHEQPGTSGLGPEDAADIWELAWYLRAVVAAATE